MEPSFFETEIQVMISYSQVWQVLLMKTALSTSSRRWNL